MRTGSVGGSSDPKFGPGNEGRVESTRSSSPDADIKEDRRFNKPDALRGLNTHGNNNPGSASLADVQDPKFSRRTLLRAGKSGFAALAGAELLAACAGPSKLDQLTLNLRRTQLDLAMEILRDKNGYPATAGALDYVKSAVDSMRDPGSGDELTRLPEALLVYKSNLYGSGGEYSANEWDLQIAVDRVYVQFLDNVPTGTIGAGSFQIGSAAQAREILDGDVALPHGKP